MRDYSSSGRQPTIPVPTPSPYPLESPTASPSEEESLRPASATSSIERMLVPGRTGSQRVNGLAFDATVGKLYAAGDRGLVLLDGGMHIGEGWMEDAPSLTAVAVDPLLKRVYATSWERKGVLVFDADSGWQVAFASGFLRPSGIVARSGRVYVADTDANRLVVLDGWTCGVVESLPLDDAPYVVALDEHHGRLYVGSPGAGTVSAFDLHAGELLYRWNSPGLGYVQGIAADEETGNLFVAYSLTPKYGAVALLDGRDGVVRAELRGNDQRPLVGTYGVTVDKVRRRFYATDYDGLLTFDADGGKLLSVTPGVKIAYSFGLVVDEASGKVYAAHGRDVQVVRIDSFAR